MHELVYVKLGGSLITDKTRQETVRLDVLSRLAEEIAQARKERPQLKLLLGHGSGSFGHFAGQRYGTRLGIRHGEEDSCWYGYAATGAAAAKLNRVVADCLLEVGLPVAVYPPSATAFCRRGRLTHLAWKPIGRALDCDLIPLVYGDVALDRDQGCTIISTEQIFSFLAARLTPQRILLAASVDGVYSQDPKQVPSARRLSAVSALMVSSMREKIGTSHGVDVTGGMLTKVLEMARLANRQPDIDIRIFSGESIGSLGMALMDPKAEPGTRIIPDTPPGRRSRTCPSSPGGV